VRHIEEQLQGPERLQGAGLDVHGEREGLHRQGRQAGQGLRPRQNRSGRPIGRPFYLRVCERRAGKHGKRNFEKLNRGDAQAQRKAAEKDEN
jgi:hypothetical protein